MAGYREDLTRAVAADPAFALAHVALARGLFVRQRIAADRYPPGDVVIWIADGFAAYAAGNWKGAVRSLEHALPQTVRIGGSRAQRDLVELTLVAAYIKDGRQDETFSLIGPPDRPAPGGWGCGVPLNDSVLPGALFAPGSFGRTAVLGPSGCSTLLPAVELLAA